ncbi:MAG: endolytic transglycosylase MltG [Thalassobaculaceae bacterium]
MMRRFTIVVLLLSAAMIGAAVWGQNLIEAPGPSSVETTVVVPRGHGPAAIGRTLEEAGVIKDRRLFQIAAWLSGASAKLQAGEYAFPAAVSVVGSLAILRAGRTVVRRVTIPEGLSSSEIVSRLLAHEALTGAIDTLPPEGSLLPETYHFSHGQSRADILKRMASAMASTVDRLWRERAPDLPLASPAEAVVLASIVEKETALAVERPVVASVFINRLRKGMRLQSDPTVVYALTGGPPLSRPLTRADLRRQHPYNTYVIKRLPPGPIANPGAAALAAVLRPAKTDFLYFVADGSGGHAFARTLAEHNRNVRAWRRLRDKKPAP